MERENKGKEQTAAKRAEKAAAEKKAAEERESKAAAEREAEDEARKARVKQAQLDRQMAEQKLAADGTPKIQEITDAEADEIKGTPAGPDGMPVEIPEADEEDGDALTPGAGERNHFFHFFTFSLYHASLSSSTPLYTVFRAT